MVPYQQHPLLTEGLMQPLHMLLNLPFGGSPQLSNPGPAQGDLDGPGEPAEPDRTGYQRLPQQDEAPNVVGSLVGATRLELAKKSQ